MFEFRAWDTLREEYLSAGLVILSTGAGKLPKTTIHLDSLKYEPQSGRFILEFYTGRKDVSGKKIYVGDKNNQGEACIWDEEDLGFKWQEIETGYINDFDHLHGAPEITGNIHEVKNV